MRVGDEGVGRGGGATCILENEDQQSFPGTSAAGKRGRLEISRRKIAICEFMQFMICKYCKLQFVNCN